MLKRYLAAALALVVVAACTDTPTQPDIESIDAVAEAAWDYKITGEGTFLGGYVVSISLTEGLNGGTKGQIQYDGTAQNGNEFHIAVDAFKQFGDVYEMCGVVNIQAEPTPVSGLVDGGRFGVAVKDVPGGPDLIRVAAAVDCDDNAAGISVSLESGDYIVREDL